MQKELAVPPPHSPLMAKCILARVVKALRSDHARLSVDDFISGGGGTLFLASGTMLCGAPAGRGALWWRGS